MGMCTSLRSHGESFRGCQLTRQQQLHCEYPLEAFISPNGWGEWVAGRRCRARGFVFPPFKHSLHCLGSVVLSGAGWGRVHRPYTSIPYTYAHSDKRSEALEVRGALWGSRAKRASKRNRSPMSHPNDPVKIHRCPPPQH